MVNQNIQNCPQQPNSDVHEYVTDMNGRQILVKSAVLANGHQLQQAPVYDCYTGQDGVPFRVLRKTQHQESPLVTSSSRMEYRRSPSSGQLYQVRVPVTPQQTSFTPSQQQQSFGQIEQVQTLPWQSAQQPAPQNQYHVMDNSAVVGTRNQSRVQGIVSFGEPGGATKNPKLIDYAKKCPTKWAKDAKSSSMNLALYGYAALAELEAGLTGRAEPLSSEELLGKVRHVKNVFEVCCINSEVKDFTAYGWVLARDYASKVENKVDQSLVTWQAMSAGVQTADLVLAQCDYPRPHKPDPAKKTKEDDKNPFGLKTCSTFNQCTTADKCDYEVANPEKNCQRRHECSYCRKHFKQSFRHQEVKCSKKRDGIVGR